MQNNEDISIYVLETVVQALETTEFTSEDATDKEEISLKVYLENENHPEIDIVLYRYDGSECIAFVAGECFGEYPEVKRWI